MGKRKKKKEGEEEQQAATIPSDLLPEILSRVPYRSLCRFKCVSRAWLAICSDPAVRRRSPQTLSGFFCYSLRHSGDYRPHLDFLNLSGRRGRPMVDPSLRFLRGYERFSFLNCCGGILLCSGWDRTMERSVYIVCNPATEEIWAALPLPHVQGPRAALVYGNHIIWLCLDHAAFPGRFAVFILNHDAHQVHVYSSDTREWTSMQSRCGPGTGSVVFGVESEHVFLNGTLHFRTYRCDDEGNIVYSIVTVDLGGDTWGTIQMPPQVVFSFIGQSLGCLCGVQVHHHNGFRISVWVLEDYASGQWTLKHTASVLELFGRPFRKHGKFYRLVAIHPECNLIFLIDGVQPDGDGVLMSYDMDNRKLHVICTLEEYDIRTFQPYIPCFADWPADAQ